jgi:hypothetical protein
MCVLLLCLFCLIACLFFCLLGVFVRIGLQAASDDIELLEDTAPAAIEQKDRHVLAASLLN